MRYFFVFLFSFFLFAQIQVLAAKETGVTWLHAEGNKIVSEQGSTVVLRGVNIERREYLYDSNPRLDYERKAIPLATSTAPNGWGANLILIAIASGPINRQEPVYLSFLDEIVNLAKANGAYTLLVYRYSEPNGEQPAMPDQAAQTAMATLAARYLQEPAVLYGLQVEPHRVSWEQLKPRFVSMIDAIRANNAKALIMVPGTQWSRYVYHQLQNPIARENLVFKSHPYDSWESVQREYFFDAMVSAGYPLLFGEFGVGSQMSGTDVQNLLEYAEKKGISWAAWTFSDEACPCLFSNRSTFEPTQYGVQIRTLLQEASGAAPALPKPSLSKAPEIRPTVIQVPAIVPTEPVVQASPATTQLSSVQQQAHGAEVAPRGNFPTETVASLVAAFVFLLVVRAVLFRKELEQ